jgi:formamidopyrimidine-DNA glycosylase
MDSAPHPLMHLGMTGWIKFSNDEAAPYVSGNGKAKEASGEWPPKYMKFCLKMEDAGRGECEITFVDPRRLARIRLVDCEGEEMRKMTPLKENGPDPVIDKDVLTKEWLDKKLKSKKVPVKALLLDQANISGVGNWVA